MMKDAPAPPPIDAETLRRALRAFAEIVGADNVHDGDELVAEFQDPYGVRADNPFRAAAVVQPGSAAEVQLLLRTAQEIGAPVWVNSQGRNNGYGGGAPRISGSVVINLRRMNRILEVNEELGYAVIEPGVSYFDLYEHLRAIGSSLWIDVPDLGWGSVIGNALDHGYGYTPYGDHVSSLCGIEFVLPDGELVRSGMGALPGAETWHTQKRGFGPSIDSLLAQSNMGVVVQAGIWLYPQPESWRACFVMVEAEDQIAELVDGLRPLLVSGVINHRVSVSNVLNRATPVSRRTDWWQDESPIPDEVIGRIAEKIGWKAWNARIGFYGSEAMVEAQFAELQKAVERIPGATLVSRKYRGHATIDDVAPSDLLLAGIPNMHVLGLLNWLGSDTGGHLGFSPIAPLSGDHAMRLLGLVKSQTQAHNLDFTAAFALQQRSMYLITLLPFDYDEPEQVHTAWRLSELLIAEAAKLGYGEYRAHLNFMDLVAEQFSFNDHALQRMIERIKDALDPAGVLSPGKQGIWPRRYREQDLP